MYIYIIYMYIYIYMSICIYVYIETSISTNGIVRCLPKIPLANKKSLTYRQITNTQVVNKIINMRITPKHFNIFLMSLSNLHQNQVGVIQQIFTCSKLAIETLEKGAKYVQS